MSDTIKHDHSDDGVDRRGFLRCMAWAGTGMLWTMKGGVLGSTALGRLDRLAAAAMGSDLFFVQISDSHIGFDKAANSDVTATLTAAVARINALPRQPAFLIHTGDISQLSKPGEFDTAQQVIGTARTKTGHVFYVPGEHDVLNDDGRQYLQRFGKGASGGGWYSFDTQGVHFIGLVNVRNLKAGGLGSLGADQLEWLERDVKRLPSSTPIVVFAHIPLWTVYPQWGWGTDDSAQALSYLKRFGSVTVLNGHIHQTLQKVEGNMFFHTALSTAFPQPSPGTAPSPGPLNVGAQRLKDFLGLASVTYVQGQHTLGLVDATLSGAPVTPPDGSLAVAAGASTQHADTARAANEIGIDNFAFTPPALEIRAGTRIVWVNRDDVPHQIVSVDKRFAPSPVIDTNQRFTLTLTQPGVYKYFCAIHPTMQGSVTVR